jgi:hypothetical protein
MSNTNEVKTDPNGASISLDARYFPLIISVWKGTPTLELSKWFFGRRRLVLERAQSGGTKVLQISDLGELSTPPATVRQYIGETGKIEDAHDNFLGYVAIVPNPVIRGVVTALRWIIGGDVRPIMFTSNYDEAIKKATSMAEAAGVEFPPIKYTPPS